MMVVIVLIRSLISSIESESILTTMPELFGKAEQLASMDLFFIADLIS